MPGNAVKAGFGVGRSNNKHYICQITSPESAVANIPGKFRDRDKTCQIVYGQGPSGQRTIHQAGFRLLEKKLVTLSRKNRRFERRLFVPFTNTPATSGDLAMEIPEGIFQARRAGRIVLTDRQQER